MGKMRFVAAVLLASLLAVMAACGGPSSSPLSDFTAQKGVSVDKIEDACKAMTFEEASSMLNIELRFAKNGELRGPEIVSCKYTDVDLDGNAPFSSMLSISIYKDPGNASFTRAVARGGTPLDGFGYEAYDLGGSLIVVKFGDLLVSTSLMTFLHDAGVERELAPKMHEMLRTFVSRLPKQ